MPPPIQEIIKRRVIQQWLSGESRDKIASDLQIGAGTVSGIVSDFQKNLQGSDIDSVRELAIDAKRQGLNLSELASHFRLYNYFIKSGAAEEDIESFIANVSSTGDIPPKISFNVLINCSIFPNQNQFHLIMCQDISEKNYKRSKKLMNRSKKRIRCFKVKM
jgi:hypothetical protein